MFSYYLTWQIEYLIQNQIDSPITHLIFENFEFTKILKGREVKSNDDKNIVLRTVLKSCHKSLKWQEREGIPAGLCWFNQLVFSFFHADPREPTAQDGIHNQTCSRSNLLLLLSFKSWPLDLATPSHVSQSPISREPKPRLIFFSDIFVKSGKFVVCYQYA